MDQIERRPFANHLEENSLFGSICGVSCHVKDVKDKLLSCETCQDMLTKETHANNFNTCCNWNVLEASYSEECAESVANLH